LATKDLLSVTFKATTYRNPRKGFGFPTELYKAFGFKGGSEVALLITKLSGEVIFCGISKFISGPEITEARTVKQLGRGQKIRVVAFRV
jgi:hypothetical protein